MQQFLTDHKVNIRYEELGDDGLQRLIYVSHGDRTGGLGGDGASSSSSSSSSANETTFETEFTKFCGSCPAWQHVDAWLFWKQNPYSQLDASKYLLIRHQLSGLCYMHAPTVLQYYKVVGHTGEPGHTMIDICATLRNATELEKYLRCDDTGQSSKHFLKFITNNAETDALVLPKRISELRSQTANAIATYLRDYGPGLVSYFKVDKNFHESKGQSFIDDHLNQNELKGLHTMLIIGYRKVDDEYRFLLQNWWKDRYFIEVSERYAAQAEAEYIFVTQNLEGIPESDKLPQIPWRGYAESLIPLEEVLPEY